jgi:hypothetical protein
METAVNVFRLEAVPDLASRLLDGINRMTLSPDGIGVPCERHTDER